MSSIFFYLLKDYFWRFFFIGLPFFVAQYLLCRLVKKIWIKLIPAILIVLVAIFGILLAFSDSSGWGALFAIPIWAAAFSCGSAVVLAWVVYLVVEVLKSNRKEVLGSFKDLSISPHIEKINQRIQNIRPYPENFLLSREIIFSGCVIILSVFLLIITRTSDRFVPTSQIVTAFGVWVFVASMAAVFSRYPLSASINTMIVFLAMVGADYASEYKTYYAGWFGVALLSFIIGFGLWFSKGKGLLFALIPTVPIAILWSLGYQAFRIYDVQMLLNIFFGAGLLIVLPKTLIQRVVALAISIPLAIIIVLFFLNPYPLY